jgi:biotin transport system substrate-specific component
MSLKENIHARKSTVRMRIEAASRPDRFPASRVNGVLLSGALISVFAFLTALGALVRVPLPFTPVPFTLQTFFVLLAGGLLGAGRGALSQMLYLGLGAVGVPVFAAGPLALVGPTGGYLAGFVVAALVVGRLTAGGRGRSLFRTLVAMVTGIAIIYLAGLVQLAIFVPAGLRELIPMGVAPFVIGDLAKLGAAAGIVAAARRRLAR